MAIFYLHMHLLTYRMRICPEKSTATDYCKNIDQTSGYATWFTAGGAIRIAHYDVIDDVITRKLSEIEKNGDHIPMKFSELSNVENRIVLRQLLQNRKLRHL